jgi:hypothetical protein
MLALSVSFLTPRAAVLAVLALIPVAALAIAAARVERARLLLRLPPPERRDRVVRGSLLAAVVLLLVLAAMQPVIQTQTSLRARTGAEAFVVVDTSRSMLASLSPGAPTRLRDAKRLAQSLGARLHGIPLGVATFTDRVLPDLFPTSDSAAFNSVVDALKIEDPPPRDVNTVATTFDALSQLATEGFFTPSTRRRAVVVITDGESRAFDPAALAGALSAANVRLAVVRVGSGADRVRRPDGTPEANYRPDPVGARLSVSRLRAAVGDSGADPAAFVKSALGSGPTKVVGVEPRSRTLSPLVALLALIPLGILLGFLPQGWLRGVTSLLRGSDRRGTVA